METQVDKEQMLDRLTRLQKNIQQVKVALRPALLQQIIGHLQELDGLCQQNLSEQRYTYYAEIFQGIETAMQEVQQAGGRKEVPEVCDMSIELLKFVEKEFCQDTELNGMLRKKKEIVFLPYKASMWDSLESIWRAAAEDQEHCNAYVVPIPYCDRNPDGTAKEWHCEVNLFPKDVPVLDYRTFDLETLHPDVIFIHNPYDDCNMATSVDCAYYSRYLKKYTELLVYVPYFVVGDTIADHFCQAPGIVNADLVIVQDENIKEQYEQYYPGGNPPKGKFLALGSPKFDKVCNTTREDYVLPEKWQKLIGNKKVILYNTSISAMLQHADKFNAKLRYVFGIFKNRDDVVLWWRPHPLLKAAMDSITPAVSAEYRRIEQQYIDEGWGIYDDTPEMDRAIVCTDAYYGDMSSLVWLYRNTEKYILIQNMVNHTYRGVMFCNIVEDKKNFYFVDLVRESIYGIDKISGLLYVIAQIPNKFLSTFWDYGVVAIGNNKIILLPMQTKKILEYDLNLGLFFEVMDVENKYYDNKGTFFRSVRYKKKYFFWGTRCSEIIKYDIDTGEYKTFNKWFFDVKKYILELNREGMKDDLLSGYCVENEYLYLTVAQANIVIEMNMDTEKVLIHIVGDDNNVYQDIIFDGERFWLLQRFNKTLILWNKENDYVDECDVLTKYTKESAPLLFKFINKWESCIVLYSREFGIELFINFKTRKIIKRKKTGWQAGFVETTNFGTMVVLPDHPAPMISSFTKLYVKYSDRKNVKIYKLTENQLDNINQNILAEYFNDKKIMLENNLALLGYIDFVKKNKLGKVQIMNMNNGEKIYIHIVNVCIR